MSQIYLRSNKTTGTTSVTNHFIDTYMPSANGEDVKVFLYLLRHMQKSSEISLASLAENLCMTKNMVSESLKYWEEKKLIELDYDKNHQLQSIHIKDMISDAVQSDSMLQQSNSIKNYSVNERAALLKQERVAELLFIAEHYLRKPLNDEEKDAVLYWVTDLKLPQELIEYLFEYCISKGHISFYYMNKVASSWAENGFKTINEAKSASMQYVDFHNALKKIFKINTRALADFELKHIAKWKNEYGFSEELILAACKKTMDTINETSFPYTDRILLNWKENNVHTLQDVEKLDSAHKSRYSSKSETPQNSFFNFTQRKYNNDDLEKLLLNQNFRDQN